MGREKRKSSQEEETPEIGASLSDLYLSHLLENQMLDDHGFAVIGRRDRLPRE